MLTVSLTVKYSLFLTLIESKTSRTDILPAMAWWHYLASWVSLQSPAVCQVQITNTTNTKKMLNWTKLKTHFLQIVNASLPDARDRCSRLIAHFFSLILLVLTSSLRILEQYSTFLYYHGSLKLILPRTVKSFNQKSIKIVTNKFTTILYFSSFIGCKTVYLELHDLRKFWKKGSTPVLPAKAEYADY